MGKPRALKKKDVIPQIQTEDASKNRKHITFDESDGDEDIHNDEVEYQSFQEQASAYAMDESDEEAPESISLHDETIKKLQELHDVALPVAPKLRKKKHPRNEESKFPTKQLKLNESETGKEDLELSDDVLELIGTLGNNGYADLINSQSQDDGADNEGNKTVYFRINKQPRSKKFGHIEATLLEDKPDLIASFSISASARDFGKQISTAHTRVSYSKFISQKRTGPSKRFLVK